MAKKYSAAEERLRKAYEESRTKLKAKLSELLEKYARLLAEKI